ncbi:MAG: hypothetical protein ACJ75B_18680 [Flavisolibacter sp.]
MQEKNYTGLVPSQVEGKEITACAFIELSGEEEAKQFYEIARQRLLFVHNWKHITGKLSADFQLTDNEGKEVDRAAQNGDHFRIDIVGPGSHAGRGYDWAAVEEIREVHENGVDSIALRVRPASDPKANNPHTAHFFSEKSTSTFEITRDGKKLTAAIYDRNIEANEETKEPIDKVRNAIVGLGAKHGLSKLQWQALAEALIQKHHQ